MFHLLKHNYKKLFDTALFFRLIVLDLSWASIHAILEVLKMETIEEYAQRIFKYETNITRLSQGVIEKCFATKRRVNPKPIVPARHILASLKHAFADCAKSQSISEIKVNKDLETEQSSSMAFDVWRTSRNKRVYKPNLIKKGIKKNNINKKKTSKWSYQKSQATLLKLDGSVATKSEAVKWYCALCEKRFPSSASFSQHKRTKAHTLKEYVFFK